jgi:hypothetical protein
MLRSVLIKQVPPLPVCLVVLDSCQGPARRRARRVFWRGVPVQRCQAGTESARNVVSYLTKPMQVAVAA